ncbi:MAG: colanic acid biosynthesis glycosyltransferase WcaL [Candidatus Electrothrix sp. AW3_4]|nr:colanic acid biosynthesis glycosyltransferase WcaL [Candidatus Electrothrix gigas]
MRIAYLINQYPKVSHTFIRREILALKELGVEVYRYSIQRTPINELVDEKDIEEHRKTYTLLSAGLHGLLFAAIRTFISYPANFLKAFWQAFLLGWGSRRGVFFHYAYLAEACLLKQQLELSGIDYIHAHFATNSTTVALLCKFLSGIEYSFTIHGACDFDDPVGWYLNKKIEHAKFVVAVSDFGRSQLMRLCSYEQWNKIKIIHCTVDDSFLKEKDVSVQYNCRLVSLGRLCNEKGHLCLLEALKEVKNDGIDFEMFFVGDGEMRNLLEKWIYDNGLQSRVHITGRASGEQVKQELLASRAMILPSFMEGLPVVIMEALALHRPVVSTYVAGIPELVEDRVNGLLVPAGSVEKLVVALKEILTMDIAQLQLMGDNGAAKVMKNHDASVEAQKLFDAIKGI